MSVNVPVSDIVDFFSGKKVFITGATGFLGSVLLRKILKECGEGVEAIYLLVRSKRGEDEKLRIQRLLKDQLFDDVLSMQPKLAEKVIPIPGDISKPHFGLTSTEWNKLTLNVSIIFHMAATIKFNESLKTAATMNVKAVMEIKKFAKECLNLKSIVYVGTAYSQCATEQLIQEKFYPPPFLTPEEFIRMAEERSEKELEMFCSKILSKFPNTYVFTKALSEDLVQRNEDCLPSCLFRPGIVTAAYKEPSPGWINNTKGPASVTAGIDCGVIRVVHGDVEKRAELVPVDYVVNALIACSYKTASLGKRSEVLIYNYVASPQNPVKWREWNKSHNFVSSCTKFSIAIKNKYIFLLLSLLLHHLIAWTMDLYLIMIQQKPKYSNLYKRVDLLLHLLSYFATREWNYENGNVENLLLELSETDKVLFPFDMRDIQWTWYFKNQVIGVKKYALKC